MILVPAGVRTLDFRFVIGRTDVFLGTKRTAGAFCMFSVILCGVCGAFDEGFGLVLSVILLVVLLVVFDADVGSV